MSDPTVDAILELLRAPDRFEELADLLTTLDDRQRKAVSARARSLAERIRWNDDSRATALAVLGCVTGIRQVVAALDVARVTPDIEPLAARVLAVRSPSWLCELPAALLVRREPRAEHFRLVRALVRHGALAQPEFPEYALAMAWGLVLDRPGTTVLDQLRADPGLLENELWALLTTERAGRALTYHDANHLRPQHWGDGPPPPARPEHTWQHALTTLAARGTVDRDRLLDTTLGALFQDWSSADLGWFVGLHDALAPTSAEIRARHDRYARLVAAEYGPAVKLGLRVLTSLHETGDLDVDLLLTSSPAALGRPDKGPVLSTLALLRSVAGADASQRERVAEVIVPALQHDQPDVKERALTLLTTLLPDAIRRQEVLDRYIDDGRAPRRPEYTAPAGEVMLRVLVPVRDADELGDLFTRLIEEADDPAEIERLLDGVLRHASARPRHGADVLARRAEVLLTEYYPGAWSGADVRADLATLALVWLRGTWPGRGFLGRNLDMEHLLVTVRALVSPPALGRGSSLDELVTRRIHEVAHAVRAGGGTSLSFPTSSNGSLPADVLCRRVTATNPRIKPWPIDACVALLRVPPDEYDALRLPESHRSGRYLAQQLRLLRERRPEWELIADRGERERRDERHAGRPTQVTWRDTADHAGTPAPPLLAVVDRMDPLATFDREVDDGEYASRFEQVTAQWPLLLPHDPDLVAAHAHPRLYRGLIKNRSGSEPLLEALGSGSRPIGMPTCSALLLGLSAKNGSARARAVDAVLELARRAALPGGALGRVFADLLRADALVASRVAHAMTEAARAAPSAGDALLDCLVDALPALAGRREAHQFIDLLAQLAIERQTAVSLPEPFAGAARGRGTSVLARACRRVPQPE